MVTWVIVSLVMFGVSILIKKKLNSCAFIPKYDKPTEFNLLGTFNGLGSSFYGGFRSDGDSEVKYIFLCFLRMPIFPIACRRVEELGSSVTATGSSTEYRIYSKEGWKLWEILQIYLYWWGGVSLGISLLFLIISVASTPYTTVK